MKYSLRSLTNFALGAHALGGAVCFGAIPGIAAVLLSVVFVLEGWREHPVKAVVSSAIMLGIGMVMLFVARLMWRDAWKTIAEIQKGAAILGQATAIAHSFSILPRMPQAVNP